MNSFLAQQLLAAPHVSHWLKAAIQKLSTRDELDAARDAAKLAEVFPLTTAKTSLTDAAEMLLVLLDRYDEVDFPKASLMAEMAVAKETLRTVLKK